MVVAESRGSPNLNPAIAIACHRPLLQDSLTSLTHFAAHWDSFPLALEATEFDGTIRLIDGARFSLLFLDNTAHRFRLLQSPSRRGRYNQFLPRISSTFPRRSAN